MASGFVENHRGGGSRIQRLDTTGHGNSNARIGGALEFFGKTSALIADKERDGLAPIDFPRRKERLFPVTRLMRARSERSNARNLELREENRKRHSCKDG